MYFCTASGMYKPDDMQSIDEFCKELVDMCHARRRLKNNPSKFSPIIGEFAGITLITKGDSTADSLLDEWRKEIDRLEKEANSDTDKKAPFSFSQLINTMVKIEGLLMKSGLGYWIAYDPKNNTYCIKVGEDLDFLEGGGQSR